MEEKKVEVQLLTQELILGYVNYQIEQLNETLNAEKFARIHAQEVTEETNGVSVVSWIVDKNGNSVKEKEVQVKPGEFVATKLDENNEPLRDQQGNLNQWVIDGTTFRKKYEVDFKDTNVFKPKGGIQKFINLKEDIVINQWGSNQVVLAGGYLNVTDLNDVYGISENDFKDTYKIIPYENAVVR